MGQVLLVIGYLKLNPYVSSPQSVDPYNMLTSFLETGYVLPLFRISPSARARAALPLDHPEYSACPRRLLFPEEVPVPALLKLECRSCVTETTHIPEGWSCCALGLGKVGLKLNALGETARFVACYGPPVSSLALLFRFNTRAWSLLSWWLRRCLILFTI